MFTPMVAAFIESLTSPTGAASSKPAWSDDTDYSCKLVLGHQHYLLCSSTDSQGDESIRLFEKVEGNNVLVLEFTEESGEVTAAQLAFEKLVSAGLAPE